MFRIAIVLALAAFPLAAQNPKGLVPWWDMGVVRDLNLTGEQSAQIRSILREHRNVLIDLRASTEKADNDVEDAFNSDTVDQRRANEAIEKLIKARGDLTREFSKLSLRLRTVLTPFQWRELQRRLPTPRGPGNPPGMQPFRGDPGPRGQPGPPGGPPRGPRQPGEDDGY